MLREQLDHNFSQVNVPQQVTCRFPVYPDMIGPAIIGRSGTHVKYIKERTGAQIKVDGRFDHHGFVYQIVVFNVPLMHRHAILVFVPFVSARAGCRVLN